MEKETFTLTPLGRLYIDLPIDISYSRMLIISLLFGTFEDILILVSLLSQNKNPFRKNSIERNYMEYYKMMINEDRCDFKSLIQVYKKYHDERKSSSNRDNDRRRSSYSKNMNQTG